MRNVMHIDNWAYLDPDTKVKIRDTIENEIESGMLIKGVETIQILMVL